MERITDKVNYYTTVKFLWQYVKNVKWKYFLFYVGWFLQTILEVVTPVIFGKMINLILYDNDLNAFLRIGFIYFILTVCGIVLYYALYEMYGLLWNEINRGLRVGMFWRMLHLNASEISLLQHGDIVNMIQFWSCEGVFFMVRNIVHTINNVLRIVICIVVIICVNPFFGIVTILMVPLSVIISFKIGKQIRSNSEKSKEKYADYMGWLFDVIHSFVELRFWSATKSILHQCEDKLRERNHLYAKIDMDNVICGEILANVKNIVRVIQYGLLVYYAVYSDLTMGMITVLITYFTILSDSLTKLVEEYMNAQTRMGVIHRIKNFIHVENAVEDDNKEDLQNEISEIAFVNCSFQYDENSKMVLREINLTINKGEKVAIVGKSGCGKSTLVQLLLGLYEPTAGNVLINGKEVSQYNKATLYEHISTVFQHVLLFKSTIRDNLQMGRKISEQELENGCVAAGIYTYVLAQKNGLDTPLEMWGGNLSGGQKQRIGLARAYVKKSDLIILDESTSALDAKNEEQILENWNEILNGRTCITITHRFQTVMQCDRVVLLRDGKVYAMGTPEEMKTTCQAFGELFSLQEGMS